MLFDLNRYSINDFKHETRQLLTLALPMMLGQIATIAIGVVDTIMAGAAGKADLSAVALGSSVFVTVFITFMGIMAALNPMIAQLFGANKTDEVGKTGQQGIWFGIIFGIIGMILMLALIVPLKNYLHMDDYIEAQFGQYLFYVALAMPFALVYQALSAYASSLNRPKPIMWINWAALIINIPLNWLFIFKFNMGGSGAGLATLFIFCFNSFALFCHIWKNPYFQPFGLTQTFRLPELTAQKNIWKLGWAIGLSYFLEVSLFSFIVWLIADLGEDFVAAQQIVGNLNSMVYMIPQAIGSAATVRVGQSIGRRQFARARYISGVSLLSGWVLALCTFTLLLTLNQALVGLYTQDASVLHIGASLLIFVGFFQLFDFTQCIASYALRGYKITRVPMVIHAIAFWLLGLLPGYALAYWANMGIYGFWAALILSLASAASALVWYLNKRSLWAMKNRAL
ncbi:MATE family efflux transporter [Wielerella bovis]|uniref:MATE family efflux transporter n=1 Tax=Wielerella bovis TaxID=2917790 RepID=UPI00201875EC|nr:MATE family efflux transporter [Wielerella bovis]ULJ70414.1 MATE family efflux transporter [Wielerella bovis]